MLKFKIRQFEENLDAQFKILTTCNLRCRKFAASVKKL